MQYDAETHAAVEIYTRKVTSALLSFQWIEAGLRDIVGMSYELLSAHAPPTIKLDIKPEDFKSDSLDALLQRYAKVSHNAQLHARIKAIVPIRNRLAHRSFILMVEEQTPNNLVPRIVELDELSAVLSPIVVELHKERGVVYDLLNRLHA